MSDSFKGKGSCLCGSISFTTNNMSKSVGACHCDMCRKWGGGPFMEVNCGAEVSFSGDEYLSVFNSSDWAERGFCKKCGTHLFYRLKDGNQHMVPVGLFDKDKDLIFDHQVFIDEKPAYYSFTNTTSNKTGAELFAEFAPPSE